MSCRLFQAGVKCLCNPRPQCLPVQCLRQNSNRTAVTKIHRHTYVKTYPVMLVQPDGSSFTIRFKEPRRHIKLPLDISTLTVEQRIAHLAKRKPKKKIVIEEEMEDNFDVDEYSKYWK